MFYIFLFNFFLKSSVLYLFRKVSYPKLDLQFGCGPHEDDDDQKSNGIKLFFFSFYFTSASYAFFFISFSETKQTTILLSCCILMQTSGAVALCSLLLSTLFTMYTRHEYQLPSTAI